MSVHKNLDQKLGFSAHQVEIILSDDIGKKHEERALEIVEKELRELIGIEAERLRKKVLVEKRLFWGLFLLRRFKEEVNIDIRFIASRYGNDPGKDIRIEIIHPKDLKGEVIDLEIKSSSRRAIEHKKKHKTPVILVKDNIANMTIAKEMLGKIREHIRQYRASI